MDAEHFVDEGSARLPVSRTQHGDGTFTQNTHVLTLSVPYKDHRGSGWVHHRHSGRLRKWARSIYLPSEAKSPTFVGAEPRFMVSFADEECEELAPRQSFTGSVQLNRCNDPLNYWRQEGCTAAIKQLAAAVKRADWRGSMHLLAIWYAYPGRIPHLQNVEEYMGPNT